MPLSLDINDASCIIETLYKYQVEKFYTLYFFNFVFATIIHAMAFHKNLLFTFVVILTSKVIHSAPDAGITPNLNFFRPESLNMIDEADDDLDFDEPFEDNFEGEDKPMSDNKNSELAMAHLAEENLKIIEYKYICLAIQKVMEIVKETLKNKTVEESIMRIITKVDDFFVNETTPKKVRKFLKKRLQRYANHETPNLIKEKYKRIESFIDNPKNRLLVKSVYDAIHKFIQKKNVDMEIAKSVAMFNKYFAMAKTFGILPSTSSSPSA